MSKRAFKLSCEELVCATTVQLLHHTTAAGEKEGKTDDDSKGNNNDDSDSSASKWRRVPALSRILTRPLLKGCIAVLGKAELTNEGEEPLLRQKGCSTRTASENRQRVVLGDITSHVLHEGVDYLQLADWLQGLDNI